MPTLTAPLKESENYNKIVEALQDGSFSVLAEGCAEAQKLHMIYSLYRESSLSALARFRLIVNWTLSGSGVLEGSWREARLR